MLACDSTDAKNPGLELLDILEEEVDFSRAGIEGRVKRAGDRSRSVHGALIPKPCRDIRIVEFVRSLQASVVSSMRWRAAVGTTLGTM